MVLLMSLSVYECLLLFELLFEAKSANAMCMFRVGFYILANCQVVSAGIMVAISACFA